MATPLIAGCSDEDLELVADNRDPVDAAPWRNLPSRSFGAQGYGRFPNMVSPSRPWPLTMNETERRRVVLLIDAIMPKDEMGPSASSLGIEAFIDEWISAPYPKQKRDAGIITSGLYWLGEEGMRRGRRPFEGLPPDERAGLIAELNEASLDLARAEPGWRKPGLFFKRMKFLTTGAYFTTPEGNKALGYVGNVAIAGDWPGPSEEALDHLRGELDKLGLPFPEEKPEWRRA
jgi:hypothetical protein